MFNFGRKIEFLENNFRIVFLTPKQLEITPIMPNKIVKIEIQAKICVLKRKLEILNI